MANGAGVLGLDAGNDLGLSTTLEDLPPKELVFFKFPFPRRLSLLLDVIALEVEGPLDAEETVSEGPSKRFFLATEEMAPVDDDLLIGLSNEDNVELKEDWGALEIGLDAVYRVGVLFRETGADLFTLPLVVDVDDVVGVLVLFLIVTFNFWESIFSACCIISLKFNFFFSCRGPVGAGGVIGGRFLPLKVVGLLLAGVEALLVDERADDADLVLGAAVTVGADAFFSASLAALSLIILCLCSSSIATGRLWEADDAPEFFDDDGDLLATLFEVTFIGSGGGAEPEAIPNSLENIDMVPGGYYL